MVSRFQSVCMVNNFTVSPAFVVILAGVMFFTVTFYVVKSAVNAAIEEYNMEVINCYDDTQAN